MVILDHNDVGKDKLEILTDLLYETNGDRIPLSKVKYGLPEEMDTRPDIKTDHNTMIPLKVQQDYSTLYENAAGLLYRRVELVDYLAHLEPGDIEFHSNVFPVQLCEILPQINAQLEYPIDCHDVLSHPIEHSGVQDIVIQAEPHSLIWTGQAKISVTVINDSLVPLYTTVALRGFDIFGEGEYTGIVT